MSIITIDDVGNTLTRVNKILSSIPGGAQRAIHSASQRAGDRAKTKAGQFAAAEYTINKGSFMSNTTIQNKSGSDGLYISFAGGVLPLTTFNTKGGRNGLISTQVKRSGGAATLAHAFWINGSVYERAGASRYPVEKKFGPSTGHMMQNETVTDEMVEVITDTFNQRIEHEIMRILNGG